jgi:hypothetical protein
VQTSLQFQGLRPLNEASRPPVTRALPMPIRVVSDTLPMHCAVRRSPAGVAGVGTNETQGVADRSHMLSSTHTTATCAPPAIAEDPHEMPRLLEGTEDV